MSSKSTFSNSTSNSYAVALYELAKENSELDKVEIEINSLYNLLVENANLLTENAVLTSQIASRPDQCSSYLVPQLPMYAPTHS
mgnify:CR=1 FL=1